MWDRTELLRRLDEAPDVLEMFFYPVFKALERRFRTEQLELIRYEIDPGCGWKQGDPAILHFTQIKGTDSDLVVDIIVRDRGTIQSLLHHIRLDIEPPLLVEPERHQRFNVKLTNAGYSWSGYIRLTLLYGDNREMPLPCTFLLP